MITVSNKAIEELNVYFDGKEKQSIRIFMATGGCSGTRLAMSIDEAGEGDSIFEEGGYTFCIKKDLLDLVGDVNIDNNDIGFVIETKNPLPVSEESGCGGCGGGCH